MKKLTAYIPENDRQIDQMVGKAMCAYANWRRATERPEGFFFKNVSENEQDAAKVAFKSEYEATVRCIDMFVKEPVPTICTYVIDRCKDEFGI